MKGSYIHPVLFTFHARSNPYSVNFLSLVPVCPMFIYLLQHLSPGFTTCCLGYWNLLTVLHVFTLAPLQNTLHPEYLTHPFLSYHLICYLGLPSLPGKDQYPYYVLQSLPSSGIYYLPKLMSYPVSFRSPPPILEGRGSPYCWTHV